MRRKSLAPSVSWPLLYTLIPCLHGKPTASDSDLGVLARGKYSKAVQPEQPSDHLDGGSEMVYWGNTWYRWHEKPPSIIFSRRAGRAVERFQISFWGITAISEGLRKGDRSLCEAYGLKPEEFTSTLRNAGVFPQSGEVASKASSEYLDNSPGVRDAD